MSHKGEICPECIRHEIDNDRCRMCTWCCNDQPVDSIPDTCFQRGGPCCQDVPLNHVDREDEL